MEKRVFHGYRLKSARQLRGMTITALAEKTGISKQSISLYENDENKPEYGRVATLANALQVPYEFLITEDNCRTQTPTTYFRSLSSATKLVRVSQSLKLEYVAKMYEALLTYIDFPVLNLPDIQYLGNYDVNNPAHLQQMYAEMESIALHVRQHWNLGDGPIKDLQYTLESNGIIVTGFNAGSDSIDAFSQRTIMARSEVCFIAVDQGSKPEGRIRFDMAHELGHLLIHPWSEDIDTLTKEEFKLRETEANAFASALLLPRSSFGKDVVSYATSLDYYIWLKNKWRASIQAMLYQAHRLDIITLNQFQYLMRQVSKRGWRKKEPGDEPYFLGDNIFQGAIDLLLNEHILTTEEILQLFTDFGVALYPDELTEILHLKPGTLKPEHSQKNVIQLRIVK